MSEEAEKPSMTVTQLYDYITSKMSCEEALKTLLATQVEQYGKMRAGVDTDKHVSPIMIMVASAAEMGWDICVEGDRPPDEIVRGMVMGTDEYINKIFPHE